MAWTELHQSLPNHWKTKRLRRTLKITQPQAVGHLCMWWLWCIDNAPDGDMRKIDNMDIAEAAGWTKDADEFVCALIGAGFVDSDRQIHDWDEYAGKYTTKRKANARRMRETRAHGKDDAEPNQTRATSDAQPCDARATNVQCTCDAQNVHVHEMCRAREEERREEESTGEKKTTKKDARVIDEDAQDCEFPPGSGPAYCRDNLTRMTDGNWAELRQYMADDDFDDQMICIAVDEACACNASSWAFVRSILDRWVRENVKTPGDAKANSAQNRARRAGGARAAPNQPPARPIYEQYVD